ncbi:hypothetical protein Ancab_038082 [Ancistrocladus abbreviatus]
MAPLRPSPEHPPRLSDARNYEIGKMKAKMIKIVKSFVEENETEALYISSVLLPCFLGTGLLHNRMETNIRVDKHFFITWALQAMREGVVVQRNLINVYEELFNAVHPPPAGGPPLPPPTGGLAAPPTNEVTLAPPGDEVTPPPSAQ